LIPGHLGEHVPRKLSVVLVSIHEHVEREDSNQVPILPSPYTTILAGKPKTHLLDNLHLKSVVVCLGISLVVLLTAKTDAKRGAA
jgi:hypothetical protein